MRKTTLDVHLGGECALACAVCDCRGRAGAAEAEVRRVVAGGGRAITFRGADRSTLLPRAIELAREAGIAEVRIRTSAVEHRDPEAAAALARLGAHAVLVPFFSHKSATHDWVAGRRGALVAALVGIRALRAAGLAIDVEVPLLPLGLQDPTALVELLARSVPDLRRVRFHLPSQELPAALTAPRWSALAPVLARAIDRSRELGIEVSLGESDGIPLCALRDHPAIAERVMRFSPRGRTPPQDLPAPCRGCAVKRQCAGVAVSYRALHGDADLAAYEARPRALFAAQRTTPQAEWTDARRDAARRVGMQVLRPTVNCNQDCVFCSANETSHELWEDPERMMRTIARRARQGTYRISFSGGEPTLSKHLVDFVGVASRMGVENVEVVTNAVLLARPGKARELADAGLTQAFVSLHAHDEALSRTITLKDGDFAKTLAGIDHLLDARVTVTVNHVVNRLNYRYLRSFVEMLHGRFGGRVDISFAFVTPQYRGLENIDLVPRLGDVMPYLARAMYRALELGQRFVVGSRQGIPPCFLREFAAWSDVFLMAQEAGTEDEHQKQKGPRCGECRYSDVCTGLWKPYVARHGTDELVPVPGDKVARAAAHRTSTEDVRTIWTARPTSFDGVPAEFRNREAEARGADGWPFTDVAPTPFAVPRSRPVRAVLVGTGARARRLFTALDEARGLTVDAVASPHAPENEAARFGFRPAYGSLAAAIEDIGPECAIIAAATPFHAELARVAIAAGIPALVEKPVGGSAEVVRQLARTSAESGVAIVPAHQVLEADGLDELLDAGPHRRVRLSRSLLPGAPDLPRSWARAGMFESLYHFLVLLQAATRTAFERAIVTSTRGSSRPEALSIRLEGGGAAAELVIEADAAMDELAIVADDWSWSRTGHRVQLGRGGELRDVERTASDAGRMLGAFARLVAGGAPMRSGLEDAARAIEATTLVLSALEEAGVELARPTEPRHAATKGLRPDYS